MGQSEQTLTRDGMTRQEYEQKTADGTLTLADVLKHREYATPEQIKIITGSMGAISNRLRIEQEHTRLISEVATLLIDFPQGLDVALTVDDWAIEAGADNDRHETQQYLRDYIGRVEDLTNRVGELLARDPEATPQYCRDNLRLMQTTLLRIVDKTTATLDASNEKACNTDCVAYVRGTCQYIDAARLSQPAEAFGLKDRRACPRYREQYPERV